MRVKKKKIDSNERLFVLEIVSSSVRVGRLFFPRCVFSVARCGFDAVRMVVAMFVSFIIS